MIIIRLLHFCMGAKELTINGTRYQCRQQYLKEDELWECAFVDVHGNMPEVDSGKLVSYDDVLVLPRRNWKDSSRTMNWSMALPTR